MCMYVDVRLCHVIMRCLYCQVFAAWCCAKACVSQCLAFTNLVILAENRCVRLGHEAVLMHVRPRAPYVDGGGAQAALRVVLVVAGLKQAWHGANVHVTVKRGRGGDSG